MFWATQDYKETCLCWHTAKQLRAKCLTSFLPRYKAKTFLNYHGITKKVESTCKSAHSSLERNPISKGSMCSIPAKPEFSGFNLTTAQYIFYITVVITHVFIYFSAVQNT